MGDMIVTLHKDWEANDPITLAAFILWRTTWIHPFDDANGRTARAAAIYVAAVKFGGWMPGVLDALQIIRNDHRRYMASLVHADDTYAAGQVDLDPLKMLLLDALEAQVNSAIPPKKR
jgi:Fic family protein